MHITRRILVGAGAAAALPMRPGRAQTNATIRIGVLNDLSGPFADLSGMGSVLAVRQAVKDFGDHGFSVEVIFADHQNKPDVGAAIARQWCDSGVDVLMDLPVSSVALSVNSVVHEKNKVLITSAAATTDLTGAQCSPNTVQWTFDVYMLAKAEATAIVGQGGKEWYLLYADYVFGQQLAREAARFVKEKGGRVVGAIAYPFPGTTDFSSYLLQAQSSGAQVLGIAGSGSNFTNLFKQSREFGVQKTMRVTGLEVFLTDVHALGLDIAQDLLLCAAFYWDLNDRTRAFTTRLLRDQKPAAYPTMAQAGCYSGALHYLKAVAAVGPARAKADGAAAVAQMKSMPIDDDAFGRGTIRADGRTLTPAYLFRVKSPAESKGPWDLYALVQTLSPDEIWRPLSEGACPFLRKVSAGAGDHP